MATTKRINGDFTIKSVSNNVDTFAIERFRTVTINGDLQVLGNTTSVETTNTTINDNMIILNQGEEGAGVTRVFSGIQIDRGTLSNVQLRYNETFNKWQLTNNGTNFGNIATFVVDPFITELSQDASPQLGGNLDVAGYTIFNSVANLNVIVDAGIQLSNRGTDLVAESGNVVVYANTVAGGGSGVYVSNADVVGQELVTKTKAIVYALIL